MSECSVIPDCYNCTAMSCMWCGSDNSTTHGCHDFLSPYGCLSASPCDSLLKCMRSEPQSIGYARAPSYVVVLACLCCIVGLVLLWLSWYAFSDCWAKLKKRRMRNNVDIRLSSHLTTSYRRMVDDVYRRQQQRERERQRRSRSFRQLDPNRPPPRGNRATGTSPSFESLASSDSDAEQTLQQEPPSFRLVSREHEPEPYPKHASVDQETKTETDTETETTSTQATRPSKSRTVSHESQLASSVISLYDLHTQIDSYSRKGCVRKCSVVCAGLCSLSFIALGVLAVVFFPVLPEYYLCNTNNDWWSILSSLTHGAAEMQAINLLTIANRNRFHLTLSSPRMHIFFQDSLVGVWNSTKQIDMPPGTYTDLLVNVTMAPGVTTAVTLYDEYENNDLYLDIVFSGHGVATLGTSLTVREMEINYKLSHYLVGESLIGDRSGCSCPVDAQIQDLDWVAL